MKLQVDGRETRNSEEIKTEIERFWKKVIVNNTEEETQEDIMIYCNTKNMEAVHIKERLERGLRKIKLGKARGTDGILGEFLKYGGN